MTRTDHLTYKQQIVLSFNPNLWPASVLDDGAYLCLDHESDGGGMLCSDGLLTYGPYVLMKDGEIQGIYHHYIKYHDFKFDLAVKQPEAKPTPIPWTLKEELTVTETVDYLFRKYLVRRCKATITKWLRQGIVHGRKTTLSGYRSWLVDRHSLDHLLQSGLLPERGRPVKEGL